jgi:hypothetical protein
MLSDAWAPLRYQDSVSASWGDVANNLERLRDEQMRRYGKCGRVTSR